MNKYEKWIKDYLLSKDGNICGKCYEATSEMIKTFPELKRIRGHVRHILSNKVSPHWWCINAEGIVFDPTSIQFVAIIKYIPHDETQPEPTGKCSNCGEYCFNYEAVCSDKCATEYKAFIESSIF